MAIEAGDYRAKACAYQLGYTQGGKEQIGIQFDFLDFPGTRMTYYGTFSSEEAERITLDAMHRAGFVGDDLASDAWVESAPEVIAHVGPNTFNGKTRMRILWINRVNQKLQMKNALDGSAAQGFAERMKGRVLAFQRDMEGGPPAQPQQQRATGTEGPPPGFDAPDQDTFDELHRDEGGHKDDSDIPF